MSGDRRDPSQLSVRDAVQRYLRRRQSDAAERSVSTWKYHLKLFAEWVEGIDIHQVGDLQPMDVDEYYEIRAGRLAPSTLESEMYTLRGFIEYLEQLSAVEDGLSDAVRIPDLDDDERSDETRLEESAGRALLEQYRSNDVRRACREHAFLEIAWTTGARMGGIRALDLRDVDLEENYLEFKHRPDTGTPLKNKRDGERPVAITGATAAVLDDYIEGDRLHVDDEHGRQPLLTTREGRPSRNTLRNWSYLATEPCLYQDCPHEKERESCDWVEFHHASKCPSSRSPHQVRTGSITWQLNIGMPPEVVAQRVNATLAVIEQHYDQESPLERMERRRRQFITEIESDL
jgi:site-specific recombinase XerD